MKFKIKLWATAAALAMTSSAFAAIDTSTNPDLLFVAYDASGSGATYVRDLGSLSQLTGTANTLFSAPAGSIFSTQMAGVSAANIDWGVFAVTKLNAANVVYETNASDNLQNRFDSDVPAVVGTLTSGLGGLTQLDLAANGYAKANGEYTGSTTLSNQTNGVTLLAKSSFGKPKPSVGVGSSQNFLSVTEDQANGTADVAQLYTNTALSSFGSGNVNGGYFTLLNTAGDLQWTSVAAVSGVPLPGAALLFVPGLLGLFGFGRRNKAA